MGVVKGVALGEVGALLGSFPSTPARPDLRSPEALELPGWRLWVPLGTPPHFTRDPRRPRALCPKNPSRLPLVNCSSFACLQLVRQDAVGLPTDRLRSRVQHEVVGRGTGLAVLGPGSPLGSAGGGPRAGAGVGVGAWLFILGPGQPVTVGFQSLPEAGGVWGTVQGHGPRLDFVRPGLAPFSSTRRIAPELGTLCPRSSLRKQIQAGLEFQELSSRLLGSVSRAGGPMLAPAPTPGGSPER